MANRKKPGAELQKIPAKTQLEPWQESLEDKRGHIWQEANEDLRKELERIQKWFDREARYTVKARWELGVILNGIHDDVTNHRGNRYGVHAVDHISTYFGWDKVTIYNALKLAQEFKEDEIGEICERKMPDGQLLTYSHLMCVISLPREERKKLIDKAVAESWTSTELGRVVVKGKEPARSQKGDRRGRPIGKPKTFDAVLGQMEAFADDFLGRAIVVWDVEEHSLAGKGAELARDDYTVERAGKLKILADKLEKVSAMATKLAKDALEVRAHFLKFAKNPTQRLKTVGEPDTEDEDGGDESKTTEGDSEE